MIPKDEVLEIASRSGAVSRTLLFDERLPLDMTCFSDDSILAFANAIAERAGGKQDAEILTGDPSEFFRSRDAADAVRAKWLNKL